MNRQQIIDMLLAQWVQQNPDVAGNETALAAQVDYLDSLSDGELRAVLPPELGPGRPQPTGAEAGAAIGGFFGGIGQGLRGASQFPSRTVRVPTAPAAAETALPPMPPEMQTLPDLGGGEMQTLPDLGGPGEMQLMPEGPTYGPNGQTLPYNPNAPQPQPENLPYIEGVSPRVEMGPGGPQVINPGGEARPRGQYSPYDDVFLKYTPPELQGDETFRAILAAATNAESGWDTNRVGDGGHSLGLFQMHDAGAGAGMGAARADPDAASARMVPAFAKAYESVRREFPSATGAELAARVAGRAERPAGTDNAGNLAVGSKAWQNYVGSWNKVSTGGEYGQRGGSTVLMGQGRIAPPPAFPSTYDIPTLGASSAELSDWFTEQWESLRDPEDPSAVTDEQKALYSIYQDKLSQLNTVTGLSLRHGEAAANNAVEMAKAQLAAGVATRGQNLDFDVANRKLGLDYDRLGLDRQKYLTDTDLALRKLGLDTAGVTGYYGENPTLEREFGERRLAAEEGALLGEFQGQPTMAARSLEETIAQNRRALGMGFAELMSKQEEVLGGAREKANALAQQQALNAPMTDLTGQYVMGHEPGGMVENLRGSLGMPFSPLTVGQLPTGPNPQAGIAELQAAFERARAQYPR